MNPTLSIRRAGIFAAGWGERLGQKIPKALTPIAGRTLIDFTLDGLMAAGIDQAVCIVNEAAGEVPRYVDAQKRSIHIDWILQTTPSSMHSFLIVLERLAQQSPGPFMLSTVDGVTDRHTFRRFIDGCSLFPEADVVLGLTNVIDDEKPLRVAMRGEEGTGILPTRVEDNPGAYEILAMTNIGFDSEYVTSGFYCVQPSILKEKKIALEKPFTALRQYLGHLLKYGYRFYGMPLPPVYDVDRPEDVKKAETFLITHASAPKQSA